MKFRIKLSIDARGTERYTPQRKGWFFWNGLYSIWLDTSFSRLDAAEDAIRNYIKHKKHIDKYYKIGE